MRSAARSTTAATLAAALVAAISGLVGAYLGSRATITTQRDQLREDRNIETRRNKAKVYATFLNATNRYASEAIRAFDRCGRRSTCSALTGAVQTARYNFQGALNDVHVYGSDQAVATAKRVAKPLPASKVGFGVIAPAPVSVADLDDAISAFLDLMCREVAANPRRACSAPR